MTTPDRIVVSIPHTGTRFLKERLDIQHHVHVTKEWSSLYRRIAGCEIIIPLRKPNSVWRAWCRRHQARNFPYAAFFLAWGALQSVANQFDVDVICVDKQEDPRIKDWTPIGDDDGGRADWTLIKADLRPMNMLPIIQEHYGSST